MLSLTPEVLNSAIVLAVIVTCLVILLLHWFTGRIGFLNIQTNPCTTWGFGFWAGSWLTILLIYRFLSAASTAAHPYMLILLDLGDLCLLACAIAYVSGNGYFKLRRLAPLPVMAGLFALFYLFVPAYFVPEGGATAALLSVSPSVVLAIVSALALGWAFFARWGLTAVPFLLVVLVYAIAQMPAYIYVFVARPHQIEDLMALEKILYWLGIGKVVLALYPLAFFFSTATLGQSLRNQAYWPSWGHRVRLTRGAGKVLMYLAHISAPVFIGLFVKGIGGLIMRLLFGIEVK